MYLHRCRSCGRKYLLPIEDIPRSFLCGRPEFTDVYALERKKQIAYYGMTAVALTAVAVGMARLLWRLATTVNHMAVYVFFWAFIVLCTLAIGLLIGSYLYYFPYTFPFLSMSNIMQRETLADTYVKNVAQLEQALTEPDSKSDDELRALYQYAYKLSRIHDTPRLAAARFRCALWLPSYDGFETDIERISVQLCMFETMDIDEELQTYIERLAQSDRSRIGFYTLKLYRRLYYRNHYADVFAETNMSNEYANYLKEDHFSWYAGGVRAALVFAAALANDRLQTEYEKELRALYRLMQPQDQALADKIRREKSE